MQVKIGNSVHCSSSEPIMVLFKNNDEVKRIIKNLENMLEVDNYNKRKYIEFPDHIEIDEIKTFMNEI